MVKRTDLRLNEESPATMPLTQIIFLIVARVPARICNSFGCDPGQLRLAGTDADSEPEVYTD